jgi:hypothetical protein
MSQDEFTKLFLCVQKCVDRLDEIERKMVAKSDLEPIYGLIDSHVRRMEDLDIDQTFLKHQLGRHERWHKQTADRIGVQLAHD